jgi:hypothetical protein
VQTSIRRYGTHARTSMRGRAPSPVAMAELTSFRNGWSMIAGG